MNAFQTANIMTNLYSMSINNPDIIYVAMVKGNNMCQCINAHHIDLMKERLNEGFTVFARMLNGKEI